MEPYYPVNDENQDIPEVCKAGEKEENVTFGAFLPGRVSITIRIRWIESAMKKAEEIF